ncbi:MAG: APC family permease [Gemmatimonadaceae bacterium]
MSTPLPIGSRQEGGRTGPHLVRGLTLLGAVALVVGNMVGTSAYTLPAALAKATGPLGLVTWVLTAAGYLLVALVYASLGTRYPRTGGPYVFAREAFGEFAGFQTVWAYWFSAVIGNAAIVTGVVGYIEGFLSVIAGSPLLKFALAQGLVWSLCVLNIIGIRQSARVQITIMFLNVIPLLALSVAALFFFDEANLRPFAPNGFGAIAAGAALVVWAYSGIESATVPAEEVQAPEHTIRRGTLIGYAAGTLVFLTAAVAVAGALPNEMIASSSRPIALVAEHTLGVWAGRVISVTAIIAGLGTLNGWILMAGRIPLSAAADGIFFRRLAAVHPRFGTPHVSLVAGTAVASVMLFLLFSRTLLEVFSFIVLLSVLTTLFPHLFAAAAELMLARRGGSRYTPQERRRAHMVAPIAFFFVLYTMYGVGPEVAMWGFLVVLAGTPLYIWFKTRGSRAGPG